MIAQVNAGCTGRRRGCSSRSTCKPTQAWFASDMLRGRPAGGAKELKSVSVVLGALLAIINGEPAGAANHVWIVGGGPSLFDSQSQIEENLKWVRQVIGRQSPNSDVQTFFNGGRSSRKDVVAWRTPTESVTTLQPLARVFGAAFQNGERYYQNGVSEVDGATEVGDLVPRLRAEVARVKNGDKVLFVFQGHGDRDASDNAGNSLKLWGDTQLTARDLGALFADIDPRVPVRLFLPQCFSGGFARTLIARAIDMQGANGRNVCAFMSVAEDKPSEGCSSSVVVGDYRDYATYFFAALDRRTRLGRSLATDPDRDGDGVVTLREAHFYSLVNGESADVPRATSEIYLEDWEPWYLRRLTVRPVPDNIYRTLSMELAARNGLSLEEKELVNDAEKRLTEVRQQTAELKRQQNALRQEVEPLQAGIRAEVLAQWPEARFPYTANFLAFLQKDLGPAQRFITHHADYARLVWLQERNMRLDEQILASDRRGAQLEKIIRLQRLARILDKFERVAGMADRAVYEKLVACEGSSP